MKLTRPKTGYRHMLLIYIDIEAFFNSRKIIIKYIQFKTN